MNILLLRGGSLLPAGAEMVSAESSCLSTLGPAAGPEFQRDPDLQRNINDAIAASRLSSGLDVNVKFTGVQHFEYTGDADLRHPQYEPVSRLACRPTEIRRPAWPSTA